MFFKEKIILSNCFNEAELLRSIAKNGEKTLGIRVMNETELCSYILMKNGKTIPGSYLSDKEADFIYFSIIGGVFDDSKNMRSSINTLRDCVPGKLSNEVFDKIFGNGENLKFALKKEKIVNAYMKYEEYKKNNNLYDKHDMINFIIDNNLKVDDVSIEYYKEMGITELLKKMLNNVFLDVSEKDITSIYPKKDVNNKHLLKAYGKKNEIDYIFNKINEEKLKLDECQIVLVDPKDIIETLVYIKKFNIPYTSTIGAPFIESNVGKMLKALIDLKGKNFGVDGYKILTSCSTFNKDIFKSIINDEKKYDDFVKYIGWLRLSFNDNIIISDVYDKVNSRTYYDALNEFNNDLKQGIVSFINKYTIDDEMKNTCISKIEELLDLKKKYEISDNMLDDFELLNQLLSSSLSTSTSINGKIHITNLDKAFSSIRKYNFIVGLDDSYPGSPIENYLIYDDDYMNTGSNKYVSSNIIEEKIAKTKAFIVMCENVNLSYSYYSLLDLKDKNPSSIIYDEIIYDEDFKPTNVESYGFENSNLTENKDVIIAKKENKEARIINIPNYDKVSITTKSLLDKTYNASTIPSFFNEKEKLKFYLEQFYGLSISDQDDLYTIIPASERGTIMHKLMEGFDKNDLQNYSEARFMEKAEYLYDEFLKKRPALIPSMIDEDKKKFLSDVKALYITDPGNKPHSHEIELSGVIGKIKIKGRYDRLEIDNNNDFILVDYKTGRSSKHKDNDVKSCIQGIIYAYFLEQKGINVKKVEFRYPQLGRGFTTDYNNSTKQEMIDLIGQIEDVIVNNYFKCPENVKYMEKYEKLLSLFKEVNQ